MHTILAVMIVFHLRMHKLTWLTTEVEANLLVNANKTAIHHHVTKLDGLNLRMQFIITYAPLIIMQCFLEFKLL